MSVTAPEGFVAGGLASGIKPDGVPDLAIVATSDRGPATAAAVFTSNRVQAAPVVVSRLHLDDGRAAAVVLNSGNANAATGPSGLAVAEATCRLTADALGCAPSDVLVCSTGLIGIPLAPEPLEQGIPLLASALAGDPPAGTRAAEAIMTTDTRSKEAVSRVEVVGGSVTIGGMAKGAAMLSPAMATMLAVVTCDASVPASSLRAILTEAVDASFHQLTVDGCTSTNDTVIVLANGAGGTPEITEGSAAFHAMTSGLTEVLSGLALQMARDAEGATKLVRVRVTGAGSTEEARTAARRVADSLLVKCSLYGEDAYWGRVLSELGSSGAKLDPDRVTIAYGGVVVCRDGTAAEHDASALAQVMAAREIDISCDLGLGTGAATMMTSDLTHAYVDENMRTS